MRTSLALLAVSTVCTAVVLVADVPVLVKMLMIVLTVGFASLTYYGRREEKRPEPSTMRQPLTPGDVSSRRFALALRGYTRAEVESFLTRVAEELHRLEEGQVAVLSSEQVRRARFPQAIQGYARHEVDRFLRRVADELDQYQQR